MSNATTRKDQASQQADKAREQGGQAVDKAKEAASGAADKLREAGSHLGEAASHAATAAGHAASSAASAVGHKAEQATAAVGSGMQSLAGTVREHTPREGVLGSASRAVADTLEDAGRYVEEKNLSGMADDLTNLIRRNPLPAVLVGVGVGFLLGRALRS